MRRAAEAGLKSARLAYVDNAVGGRWSDCGVVLDAELMAGFLDGAADQVSGYYENMSVSYTHITLPTNLVFYI